MIKGESSPQNHLNALIIFLKQLFQKWISAWIWLLCIFFQDTHRLYQFIKKQKMNLRS